MDTPEMLAQKAQALQAENERLKRALAELALLNELAAEIGASLDTQDVMQKIIRRSLRAVNAEQGVITLIAPLALTPAQTLVRTRVSSSSQPAYHLEQNLQGWMMLNKMPLVINDPYNDGRFQGVEWEKSIRSLVCVPLMVKSALKGLLTIYNKKAGGEFTAEDQRLLSIIAAQSAQVVENARLYEGEQAFRRMQEELKFAAKIQLDLLPKSMPLIPGYDIAGKSLPAQSVGGDYFDFIPMNESRLAFCLGDVSGKGLPASLLMANLQATMRGLALMQLPAHECLRHANKLLYGSTDKCNFVTLFYGILDFRQHRLHYASAGHNPPFLFLHNQNSQALTCHGLVLGIRGDTAYEEETVALSPGDLLLIYSDGITEAMNAQHEEFGEERLIETVRKYRDATAHELIEKIMQAVKQHAGNTPQSDDMTLMALRRME